MTQPDESPTRSPWNATNILIAVATVMIVLSFTVFDWFSQDSDSEFFEGGNFTFSNIGDGLDRIDDVFPFASKYIHTGVAGLYYGWLGWGLFILAVVAAVVASVSRQRNGGRTRIFPVVVGLVSAGITFWALNLFTVDDEVPDADEAPSFGDFLSHATIGAYLALFGFLILGLAGVGQRAKR